MKLDTLMCKVCAGDVRECGHRVPELCMEQGCSQAPTRELTWKLGKGMKRHHVLGSVLDNSGEKDISYLCSDHAVWYVTGDDRPHRAKVLGLQRVQKAEDETPRFYESMGL